MIKVYFEGHSYCELVAIFRDETTYHSCLKSLEAEAISRDMILTESVEDEEIINLIKS